MVINLLAFISSLILSVSNNFIENDLFSVEMSFSLVEETKKKDIYEINFVIVNKINNPLYYVASYEKSSSYSQPNNLDENIDTNKDVDSSISDSDPSAPPPLFTSAYQESFGVAKVDSEPARTSSSNKVITNESKLTNKKKSISQDLNFILKNDFFKLNLKNSKNAKFFSDVDQNPMKPNFIKNKEEFQLGIKFDNLTEKEVNIYKDISAYNPIICQIPVDGLVKKTILETNKKNGVNPNDFFLTFSKNKINISKLSLELDMTFHKTIDEAVDKFLELQKVLKESL
ncbi:MAG: hypothetical protein VXY09_00945 [Bacteroidota bacterium]|nr:hypothetical protein [Bacteroidota bacterium]